MKKFFPLFLLGIIMTLLLIPAPVSASLNTTYTSNWAGYVTTTSTSSPFTSVSATWTVPSLKTTIEPGYSSAWVGIGGFYRNSSKLIQAGTEQDIDSNGKTTYSVWYEIFPKFPVTIATIEAGTAVSVLISKNTGSKPETWKVTIDYGASEPFSQNFKLKPNFASQTSAEFIVERPLLVVGHQTAPLADFGSIEFTSCNTNLDQLSSLTNVGIIMTDNGTSSGTQLASPGIISGDNFTVDYIQ